MQNAKYDFKCIYYVNQIIVDLINENYFIENMIDPETLRYVLYQLVQNNFNSVGRTHISHEQMMGALSFSKQQSLKDIMDDMIKEGLVEYNGIDDNGEYIMRVTEAGMKSYEEDSADHEEIRKSIEAINRVKNKHKDNP